jgi:hypothetical protein|tara:strand:+ start:7941 stop:8594 length:654 start_codon:yes stop_codon:yes gene_type:complete
MAVYAKGRKAVAICDRSGFRIPYKNLRTEWTGLRVAPDEYEPKNPQLTPPTNIIDATALFKPRPDNDPENIIINLHYDWFNFNLTQPQLDSTLYNKPNEIVGRGATGRVTIETPIEIAASSVHNQGLVGAETIEVSITEVGVAGTGAVGTIASFESTITETGVAGTGTIGTYGETDGVNISVTETGVAGTGATGTESVDIDDLFWGGGTWGNGSWGQ